MKQKAFRQNKTGVAPPLKSLSPATGTSGHKYELYHVNHLHITFTFARWVYNLPGEICYFLRFPGAGRSRYTATDERSGGNSLIFSFTRRSGVRRWTNTPLTMWNAVNSTITASWFCTMKPLIICGKCSDTVTDKHP